MNLSDPIMCAGCGKQFTLTDREVGFYAEMMGKDPAWGPPKRCKPCRDERKREKQSRDRQY